MTWGAPDAVDAMCFARLYMSPDTEALRGKSGNGRESVGAVRRPLAGGLGPHTMSLGGGRAR